MTNDELAEAVASLNELHATANITEMYLIIRQLWAEREAMEKEMLEQSRIIGAGGERELALLAKVEKQHAVMAQVKEALDLICTIEGERGASNGACYKVASPALAALESVGVSDDSR